MCYIINAAGRCAAGTDKDVLGPSKHQPAKKHTTGLAVAPQGVNSMLSCDQQRCGLFLLLGAPYMTHKRADPVLNMQIRCGKHNKQGCAAVDPARSRHHCGQLGHACPDHRYQALHYREQQVCLLCSISGDQ